MNELRIVAVNADITFLAFFRAAYAWKNTNDRKTLRFSLPSLKEPTTMLPSAEDQKVFAQFMIHYHANLYMLEKNQKSKFE